MPAILANSEALAHSAHPDTSPLLLRILNWIAAKDAGYRQATKLRGQPDERLKDMGITRQQADQGFYSKYGNKSADQDPIVLIRGR